MPGTAAMGRVHGWSQTGKPLAPKPAASWGEELTPLARQPPAQEHGHQEMTWISWPAHSAQIPPQKQG